MTLGPKERNPYIYEISIFLEAMDKVSACLRAKSTHQTDILASLVQNMQTDFDDSLQKFFLNPLPIRQPKLLGGEREYDRTVALSTGHGTKTSSQIPWHLKDIHSCGGCGRSECASTRPS